MLMDEEITVLYNNCYGKFAISEEAIDLYNKKRTEIDPTWGTPSRMEYSELCRHDPILLQIYYECDKFDAPDADIYSTEIPKKYQDYYEIKNDNGAEDIVINYNRYELDKKKNILNKIHNIINNKDLSSDNKVDEIKNILCIIEL
jgi:hypothetical protein